MYLAINDQEALHGLTLPLLFPHGLYTGRSAKSLLQQRSVVGEPAMRRQLKDSMTYQMASWLSALLLSYDPKLIEGFFEGILYIVLA